MPGTTNRFSDRILLITWNFPPKRGGMENLIYDIYKHLSSEYKIDVIAPFSTENDTSNTYRPKHKGFIYFLLFAIFKGCQLLVRHKQKYIFGGSLTTLPVLTVLRIFFRIKSIAYAHGLDIIYNNRIYQLMLRLCIPFMDGFICNSENTKNILVQNFPKAKSVTVIPPGLDIEEYDIQTERPYTRKYILSVGRLTERKGLIEFIENSFLHIAKQFSHVDFVIIGDEPREAMYHKTGYKQKLQDCIHRLGLQDRVILNGWVEEKKKLAFYQHCECLVFPVIPAQNDVEGFGIVAIEAGAMGSPTVAFDIGGIRDAVINNENGIIIQKLNYQELTSHLQSILKKEKKFNNIKSCIKERFAWSSLCKNYRKVFNQ